MGGRMYKREHELTRALAQRENVIAELVHAMPELAPVIEYIDAYGTLETDDGAAIVGKLTTATATYAGQVVNLARFLCARGRVGLQWKWRTRQAIRTGARLDLAYGVAARGPRPLLQVSWVTCPTCNGAVLVR